MNRSFFRKLAKLTKTPEAELKLMEEKAAENARNEAIRFYTLAIVWTLHNKWGFGETRLQRFMEQANEIFEDINGNWVSFEDINQQLRTETGIYLRGETK